ncbi:MAG TPA: peptidoglycan-associated lipoprotein Pal [Thermoanaerobaculia bacterium]|nr:peptidoglycan-associated lipoprotein Pal [Thermoanaerobaculia bacterium]
MNRKWMIWIVAPVLLTVLYGCPKKKPATPAQDLDVNTTTVTPPPPTQEVTPEPVATPPQDTVESNPLDSPDLQVVNAELQRRGFSPDVYFDYDESSLSDDARAKLARNADLLKTTQLLVTIEGHADERGTNEYNLALGDKRANAVRDYLTSLGVDAGRLRTLSYGEERPVCTESEESCWSQNRRGHMVITGRANMG